MATGGWWLGQGALSAGLHPSRSRNSSADLPPHTLRGKLQRIPPPPGPEAWNPGSSEYPRNVGATGETLCVRLLTHP